MLTFALEYKSGEQSEKRQQPQQKQRIGFSAEQKPKKKTYILGRLCILRSSPEAPPDTFRPDSGWP